MDREALDGFLKSVHSAVADGGPVEQRALHEASPKVADAYRCSCREADTFQELLSVPKP